ncbi:hypothetical protein [Alkalihalobacillus sp. BA299]|uniref:hypothetical protein n=1 Tax=Alkalihalobacillus sp. BA299 TaxID=2815938 RepID=UPI001ADAAE5C|nr:hypothetical protein [Alkalihalobacillus sp. BA299]
MWRKIILCLLMMITISTVSFAHEYKEIEIFNIEKDQVIKKIPMQAREYQEVEKIIEGINNIQKKFNPLPTKGIMIKVPLEPSIKVENQWFNDLVDQVIFILPEDEDPYLLLFTDENTPIFLTFKGNMDTFLSKINFHSSQAN